MTQTPIDDDDVATQAADLIVGVILTLLRVVRTLLGFVLTLLWIIVVRLLAILGDEDIHRWMVNVGRNLWRMFVDWWSTHRGKATY